jgi:hypothetical protein
MKFGDLDQQEKGVARTFQNKGSSKVQIHNVKTLMIKMKELQSEIGFNDDDIMIIMFTSLDHDYLTNLLLLAGEFMMWFNLNFEGDSREEVDFKDNKCEIWKSTCTYATNIIAAHAKMTNNHEVMMSQKWWNHQRYHNFGNQLSIKFKEKPNLQTEMRSMFKKQMDKMSYYDLFQFIEHVLGIKLQTWEEDALEGRLDRLGFAFIEFNEFNEFSMEYGISWNEPLLETDLEDILDAKLNLSYKDY